MFFVRFTPESKALIAELFAREQFAKPGITIFRQWPRADVSRANTGKAPCNVGRSHPWRAQVGDFHSFGDNPQDVLLCDGVLVWLALIPKLGRVAVEVSVRAGDLFVDEIHVQPGS